MVAHLNKYTAKYLEKAILEKAILQMTHWFAVICWN